jgi:hypothetical protein
MIFMPTNMDRMARNGCVRRDAHMDQGTVTVYTGVQDT